MSKHTKTTKSSTTKANKAANKVKARKAKAPKVDRFGFELGTNQATVNAAMSSKRAKTVAQLAEETGLDHRRCRYQCRVLQRAKLAKRINTDEGLAYRLAK
jgi:phage-related protein